MTTATRGEMLLHTVCALMPDRDQAARIKALDATDHITFAEAYCAVRQLPSLTPDLRRALLEHVYELMDGETKQVLRSRRRSLPSRRRSPHGRSRLTTLTRWTRPETEPIEPGPGRRSSSSTSVDARG